MADHDLSTIRACFGVVAITVGMIAAALLVEWVRQSIRFSRAMRRSKVARPTSWLH